MSDPFGELSDRIEVTLVRLGGNVRSIDEQ